MKRLALLMPAMLLCTIAIAAEPVTYDIKIVEDGHLVYGFTTTAPMGKGIHLESTQIDQNNQDVALDYINDKFAIDVTGNVVNDKGVLNSMLSLTDLEKYIDAAPGEQLPLINLPKAAKSSLTAPLKLVNGEPQGLSYSLGTTTSENGNKPATEPRTVVITATWIH
jgi:hypothetical protein